MTQTEQPDEIAFGESQEAKLAIEALGAAPRDLTSADLQSTSASDLVAADIIYRHLPLDVLGRHH